MRDDTYVTLVALEHDWGHAWMTRNVALCEQIMADDFLEVSALGRLASRGEWIAAMRAILSASCSGPTCACDPRALRHRPRPASRPGTVPGTTFGRPCLPPMSGSGAPVAGKSSRDS
jgi:hypothetical protein